MRHRRLAGCLTVTGLVDDQRLAGVSCLACRFEKTPAVLDALQQADNRPGIVIFSEIGNEVADIDVARIARCEIVREADAALHALQHGVTECAALRHNPDRPRAMPHARIVGHKIQSGLRLGIGETDAIGSDYSHTGAMRKVDQAMLRRDAVGLRRLRES